MIVNKVRKLIIRKCIATASVHWYNACSYERTQAGMKRVHIWQGQTDQAFKLSRVPLFLVCLCIKQGI